MSQRDFEIFSHLVPDSKSNEPFLKNDFRYLDNTKSTAGLMSFTTRYIMSDWISLRDAYLEFKMTIASAAATKDVCFKRCMLDMIRGVQLTINTQNIVNVPDIQNYNYWSLLFTKSKAFASSVDADQLHFAVNEGKFAETKVATDHAASPNNVVHQPIGLASNANTLTLDSYFTNKQNPGFISRITKLGSSLVGNNYEVTAKIPLKYIHPIFSTPLGHMPLSNMLIELTFTDNSPKTFFAPLFTTANGGVGAITMSEAKLYYRHLVFNPVQAEEVAKLMTSGFTKQFKFLEIESGNQPIPRTGQQQVILSNTVVLPQKLMFACFTSGHEIDDSKEAPAVITPAAQPTSYNVMLNNSVYFDYSDIKGDYQQYRELSDACHPENDIDGFIPLVDFTTWRYYNKIQACNLGYLKSRSGDPLQSVNVKLNANFPTITTLYYALESLRTLTMDFTETGKVHITNTQEI